MNKEIIQSDFYFQFNLGQGRTWSHCCTCWVDDIDILRNTFCCHGSPEQTGISWVDWYSSVLHYTDCRQRLQVQYAPKFHLYLIALIILNFPKYFIWPNVFLFSQTNCRNCISVMGFRYLFCFYWQHPVYDDDDTCDNGSLRK